MRQGRRWGRALRLAALALVGLTAGCRANDLAAVGGAEASDAVASEAAPLTGYAGGSAAPVLDAPLHLVARARPFECIAGQVGEAQADVTPATTSQTAAIVGRCAEAANQTFVFDAAGTVRLQADGRCLQADANGDVALADCDGRAQQRWRADGHLLQNVASKTCLARHDGERAATVLAAIGCDADADAQAWAFATLTDVDAALGKLDAAFPQASAALPASTGGLLGYAALEAAPPTYTPVRLALRQGVDDCVDAKADAAGMLAALRRCEQANDVMFAPDGTIQTAYLVGGRAPLCFGGQPAGDGNGERWQVQLTACDGNAAQRWQARGHNLQHGQSGLCLAMDPSAPGIDAANVRGGATLEISLLPCDANAVTQAWAYGSTSGLRLEAKAAQENLTVAALCAQAVQVTVVLPTPIDQETAWLLAHFGGDANAVADQVRLSIAQDCSVVWQRPQDVLVLPPVLATFFADDGNNTASSNWLAGPLVNFNVTGKVSNYARRAQGDSYPDYVLRHELAHIWDRRALPYKHSLGLVEGYADLVAYRTGYRRPNTPRYKGGAFDNGYGDAMWFLEWLDTARYPAAVGQRFTDLEQRQALTLPADPNWFATWTLQQTGSTLPQLWDAYQASF